MGLDVKLNKILKPIPQVEKSYREELGVYFDSISELLDTITGRQLIAKYPEYLAKREVECYDMNWIIRNYSKFYTDEKSIKDLGAHWSGCGPGETYFTIYKGNETEEVTIPDSVEIPTYFIEVIGFYSKEVKYLQRKGLKVVSKGHKDFRDFKKQYQLYLTTQEHLEALKELVVDCERTPDNRILKLKKIPNLHYIDINA